LDLNDSIKIDKPESGLSIPVIEWIKKFCLLHKEEKLDWTLCLTLQGEISWDDVTNKQVIDSLLIIVSMMVNLIIY
jgi:hypothetical protein